MSLVLDSISVADPAAGVKLAALVDSAVPAGSIADVLADFGHSLDPQVVRRHRRRSTPRGCKCPK